MWAIVFVVISNNVLFFCMLYLCQLNLTFDHWEGRVDFISPTEFELRLVL